MWAVEVVVVKPGVELFLSFGGVFVGSRVGPFSECGLDEMFGLSVGARRVGPGEALVDVGHA